MTKTMTKWMTETMTSWRRGSPTPASFRSSLTCRQKSSLTDLSQPKHDWLHKMIFQSFMLLEFIHMAILSNAELRPLAARLWSFRDVLAAANVMTRVVDHSATPQSLVTRVAGSTHSALCKIRFSSNSLPTPTCVLVNWRQSCFLKGKSKTGAQNFHWQIKAGLKGS